MARDEFAAAADDALGFITEKPKAVDDLLDVFGFGVGEIGGGFVFRKQLRCDHVHGFVGALGGENGGDEQLQGIAMLQLAMRFGVCAFQASNDFLGSFRFGLVRFARH